MEEETEVPNTNPRILFRSYVKRTTLAGEVYCYLIENPVWDARTGKEMAVFALTAFYLPYARQESVQDKASAQFAIEALQRQIYKLQADFGISPQVTTATREGTYAGTLIKDSSPVIHEQIGNPEPDFSPESDPSKKTVPDAFYGAYDLFEEG